VTFLDAEKAWARFQDQLPSTHPVADQMPDVESVHQNFDGITYAKGASVLRQLVAWVGQDEFLAGCRDYFDRHAWGNTTSPTSSVRWSAPRAVTWPPGATSGC
jgi:aminopeptidase N